ncbi:hypothetical protein [Sphingomonas profundi]|uniref:hypothetical protein n=1 Tax=Alterirhizorhabdus profundi TaxID=2681549 RepID=UPI0018D16FA9|nr:hypothetical protein [Sphingomonas profundi]
MAARIDMRAGMFVHCQMVEVHAHRLARTLHGFHRQARFELIEVEGARQLVGEIDDADPHAPYVQPAFHRRDRRRLERSACQGSGSGGKRVKHRSARLLVQLHSRHQRHDITAQTIDHGTIRLGDRLRPRQARVTGSPHREIRRFDGVPDPQRGLVVSAEWTRVFGRELRDHPVGPLSANSAQAMIQA